MKVTDFTEVPEKLLGALSAFQAMHAGDGNRVALVPVVAKECGGFAFGLAVEGSSGYVPVPELWFTCADYTDATQLADRVNVELFDLDPAEAAQVVGSTMFKPVEA